jgi:eukaryotic-like serine/threonine-protein kinase
MKTFLSLILAAMFAEVIQAPAVRLAFVDREGHQALAGMVPASTFAPRISPDGREVVFDTSQDGILWIAKLPDLSAKRQLTTEGRNRGPLWSGDGKRILYITDYEREEVLFWRNADGTGTAELLTQARAPESWSSRLQVLSFIRLKPAPAGDYDVWTYSLSGKQATPLIAIPGSPQHSSSFSPDGRWIAYVSAETGRLEVYVQAFPGPGAKIQITKEGGGHPLWSPDQRELFFDNNARMFVVPIRTQPNFTAGEPMALPITGFIQGPLRRQYDLTPDGKQFLMLFR